MKDDGGSTTSGALVAVHLPADKQDMSRVAVAATVGHREENET